ncbi:MAG: hypothetical protein LUG98_05925 [Tannerellaceae bacterium]|nr:hypothetical protein [Tannerellaceae bacterium]
MDFSNLPIHYWILTIIAIAAFNIPYLKKVGKGIRKGNKLKKLSDTELLDMETLRKEVQKDANLTKLKTQIDKSMEGKLELIPVYGYRFKNGVLTQTIYNYVFGFNPDMEGFILVAINSKGKPLEYPLRFDKSNVTSLKYMFDGSLQVKSPILEDGSLAVIIPGFTLDNHKDMYMLHVNQVVTTAAFKKHLKQTYNF